MRSDRKDNPPQKHRDTEKTFFGVSLAAADEVDDFQVVVFFQ
jgi:hypothetical protein